MRGSRILVACATILLWTSSEALADKCTSSKLKATGKYMSALLNCHAKVASTGDGSGLTECKSKASGKLTTALTKAGACSLSEMPNGSDAECGIAAAACESELVAAIVDVFPSKCVASKRKAAGKYARAQLGCYAKAESTNVAVDPACLSKAAEKLVTALSKAGSCPDGGTPQNMIEESCVDISLAADNAGVVTDVCPGAQCPASLDLTVISRGNDVSVTRDEMGWKPWMHSNDVAGGYRLSLPVSSCTNPSPPCGTCIGGGQTFLTGRCSNDRGIECTTLNGNDDACGGNRCDFFASAPQPTSADGFPMCVEHRLTSIPVFSYGPETGSMVLDLETRVDMYFGSSVVKPCPTCAGDAVMNDGLRDGLCDGGARDGLACDAEGTEPTWADLGTTSSDCPPLIGSGLTGGGVAQPLMLAAGAQTLTATDACDSPYGAESCPCGVCSGDESVVCTTDSDCSGMGLGTCGNGFAGATREPNDCTGHVCTDVGGGRGACLSDDRFYCDGFTRADGSGLIACTGNPSCEALDEFCPGGDCGDCTLGENPPCFLNPIETLPAADPETPLVADILCVPPTSSGTLNSIMGLPGPRRVHWQLAVDQDF